MLWWHAPPPVGHTYLNVVCKWAQLGNCGLYSSQTDRPEIPSSLCWDPGCATGVWECVFWPPKTVVELGLTELGEGEPLTPRGLGWGIDPPMGQRGPLFQAAPFQVAGRLLPRDSWASWMQNCPNCCSSRREGGRVAQIGWKAGASFPHIPLAGPQSRGPDRAAREAGTWKPPVFRFGFWRQEEEEAGAERREDVVWAWEEFN